MRSFMLTMRYTHSKSPADLIRAQEKYPVPMPQRPSHEAIASEAGVSRSMVSAFLSGRQYQNGGKGSVGVGKASKEKIRTACLRLNYIPEDRATLFRLYPRTAPVGLFLERGIPFSSPVHSRILEGVIHQACEDQIETTNLIYSGAYDYLTDPGALPDSILRGALKKVIIVGGLPNYSLIHQLMEMQVHVVLVGKASKISGCVSVVPDYYNATCAGIRMLHDKGHRDIAIVLDDFLTPDSYHGRLIRDASVEAMHEMGLDFSEEDLVIHNGSSKTEYHHAAQQILARKVPPTAIYCQHGETARGLAVDLAMGGIRIPDDIGMMVGDDDVINQNMIRGFSGVHLPYRKMGSLALNEVNRIAEQGSSMDPKIIMVPFELIDRDSVKVLA